MATCGHGSQKGKKVEVEVMAMYCVPLAPHRQTAYLSDVGEQVVGDALGILSDEPTDVSADRVEVPQQNCIPVLCTNKNFCNLTTNAQFLFHFIYILLVYP